MSSGSGSGTRAPRPTRTVQTKNNPALQALIDYGYPEKQSRAFLNAPDAERLHQLLIHHKRAPTDYTFDLPTAHQELHVPGKKSNTNWVLLDPLSTSKARNPELFALLNSAHSSNPYISTAELRRLPLRAFVPDQARRARGGKYLEYNIRSHAFRVVSVSRLGDLEVVYTNAGPRMA
ncbi:hypothetical protein MBLNU457_4103t1 [Dothideomycetes sp. NU457]